MMPIMGNKAGNGIGPCGLGGSLRPTVHVLVDNGPDQATDVGVAHVARGFRLEDGISERISVGGDSTSPRLYPAVGSCQARHQS